MVSSLASCWFGELLQPCARLLLGSRRRSSTMAIWQHLQEVSRFCGRELGWRTFERNPPPCWQKRTTLTHLGELATQFRGLRKHTGGCTELCSTIQQMRSIRYYGCCWIGLALHQGSEFATLWLSAYGEVRRRSHHGGSIRFASRKLIGAIEPHDDARATVPHPVAIGESKNVVSTCRWFFMMSWLIAGYTVAGSRWR
jgi:hypothetical protein